MMQQDVIYTPPYLLTIYFTQTSRCVPVCALRVVNKLYGSAFETFLTWEFGLHRCTIFCAWKTTLVPEEHVVARHIIQERRENYAFRFPKVQEMKVWEVAGYESQQPCGHPHFGVATRFIWWDGPRKQLDQMQFPLQPLKCIQSYANQGMILCSIDINTTKSASNDGHHDSTLTPLIYRFLNKFDCRACLHLWVFIESQNSMAVPAVSFLLLPCMQPRFLEL